MPHHRYKWFSINPIFFNLVRILIAISIYHYLSTHELFPTWLTYIYYITKIYIAFEIVIGSGRTLMMPLLTLVAGALCFLAAQNYNISYVSVNDAWQLMLMAAVGLLISLLI